MSNPPRQKGTKFENEVLRRIQEIYPDADRAKAGSISCDIVGAGMWVIECKHRKRWNLFGWIARIRDVAGARPWVIIAAHGARNTVEGRGVGTVAIIDADQFYAMITFIDRYQTLETIRLIDNAGDN